MFVHLHKLVQSFIQCDYFGTPLSRQDERGIQFYSKVRAAFGSCVTSGIVDQDLSHQAGCHC